MNVPGLALQMFDKKDHPLDHSGNELSESKTAAKLALTIFGDIGELARRRLEPNNSFLSFVSVTNNKLYF